MITPEYLEKLAEIANAEHRTDDIEIDELLGEHELSISDEGIWVRAWAFLSYPLLEEHGLTGCDILRHSQKSAKPPNSATP